MSWIEVTFVFVLNMSAITFVFRMLKKSNWSSRLVPIIVTLWSAVHMSLVLLGWSQWWISAISFSSVFAVRHAVKRIIFYRQRKRYPAEVLFFLNVILVQLKAGKSLSAVLKTLIKSHNNDMSAGLRRVFEVVSFSQHDAIKIRSNLLKSFLHVLLRAQSDRHLARTMLENLREELSFIQKFRHRSGQSMLQARMQAFICLAIYLFISVITVCWMGFESVRPFLAPSLSLMFMGMIGIFLVGRKPKWKV